MKLNFATLHNTIGQHGNGIFAQEKINGVIREYTWADLQRDYLKLASFIKPLSNKTPKVAIMANACYGWTLSDFATQALGGISIGLYANDRDSVLLHNIELTKPDVFIVENDQLLNKIQTLYPQAGWHIPVIVMHSQQQNKAPVYSLDSILSAVPDNEKIASIIAQIENLNSQQAASYIFTSGTTGFPKAVVLSLQNMLTSAHTYARYYPVTQSDSTILYLPFSHVFARVMFYASVLWGQKHVYVNNIDNLVTELPEISPSVFLAVPRLLEKVVSKIQAKVAAAPLWKRLLVRWAFNQADKNPQRENVNWQLKLADRLVFSAMRSAFGKNLRFMGSGGGKLPHQVTDFFARIGIPIYEGYATTESGGFGIFNYPGQWRSGYIGKTVDPMQVKIAEDGELLLNSPANCLGYLEKDGSITPVCTQGWLATGDITRNDDGYLAIIDRKKDIMVTAYGKNVAPSWIESQLISQPEIDDAVIIGDGLAFLSALIVPADTSPSSANAVKEAIQRVNKNLSRHEQIRQHLIVPAFDIESGTITSTYKKRRAEITRHYQQAIDEIYQNTTVATSTNQLEPA